MGQLTQTALKQEAAKFANVESSHWEPTLYGITDGKAVGTHFEHEFQLHLHTRYEYEEGSSAEGIDFPSIDVDMKVTSIKQPQSSCPYESARQKIYGLGYSILVFVYTKEDDETKRCGRLNIEHIIFIEADQTSDYQMTTGITEILSNDGNKDDLIGFFADRMLPVDDIEAQRLADSILEDPPKIGYLTISNALQWRLRYCRVIEKAGQVQGVHKVK